MCDYANDERKSKKIKTECEELDIKYNQRQVYNYEDYYQSVICKETNNINYLRAKTNTKPIKTWFFYKRWSY